ncbi:hypothetical protein Q3G72_004637 [Acer saccharum]|nr:hypothetical protein Q3G72_004637 [Acer saccharum]
MIQISVDDIFEQPAPVERQYNAAAHGETSHANQQHGSVNNAHIKGMHDVLQVVKDIQATLKTELSDIRTKVNFLYAKYSSAEDKNSEDLQNTNSHHKSKHQSPLIPSLNSPPPPPSRPLIIPTIQNPVVEDTLNDDNCELESLSSNKRRIIQTRSTFKRKPSRYQISPYIAEPVHVSMNISYAEAPNKPNGYDHGLFVCMFMDDNYPTLVQIKSFQSECQRLFWAQFLALFPGNTNLLTLKKNSQEHYNKLVSNNEVVPRLNMRSPPMKKLKADKLASPGRPDQGCPELRSPWARPSVVHILGFQPRS